MGCAGSSRSKEDENIKHIRKPKPWKHLEPISRTQLMQMRDEFWDTAPHYGGNKEIWDALRAAAEADLKLAQAIVDSAGVIVQSADLTICYDERGARYELPNYVLSEPTNLIKDAKVLTVGGSTNVHLHLLVGTTSATIWTYAKVLVDEIIDGTVGGPTNEHLGQLVGTTNATT
ncbi:hypothetical protein FNV43_RR07416 [Rhamnella rubrinervis]|uniref:DC-UbP/UBTD2 N-terminal domain-containing protein n=1 Tax=Rhamnella rubrinervis TaxID=2594499 RepID=A0A8K0HER1_9ROSA|nr:hypothetical protein FNV43_RR07416 [Rhamnella rubrinervis]